MLNYPEEKPIPSLENYAGDFYKDRCSEFQALMDFFKTKDYLSIQKMGHKWKGFCEPYGFNALAVLGQELEFAAHCSDYNEVDKKLKDIKEYLNKKGQDLNEI